MLSNFTAVKSVALISAGSLSNLYLTSYNVTETDEGTALN